MRLLSFIACLAVIGILGCKKEDPAMKTLPGRRMAEMDVISLAGTAIHQQVGYSYHTSFTNGVWEVSCKTNKTQMNWQVIATIQDADGKIELVNRP